MKIRHDTPKSHTQQRKFKIYPIAMSGVLDSFAPVMGSVTDVASGT
jgi:hypothetical protein